MNEDRRGLRKCYFLNYLLVRSEFSDFKLKSTRCIFITVMKVKKEL